MSVYIGVCEELKGLVSWIEIHTQSILVQFSGWSLRGSQSEQ